MAAPLQTDAESNLKAFALRLKEAMPELVMIHETHGFFFKCREGHRRLG
jgi:hypothetical protein